MSEHLALSFALLLSPAIPIAAGHTIGLCHDKVRVTAFEAEMTPDGPHGAWHGCVKLWGTSPTIGDALHVKRAEAL